VVTAGNKDPASVITARLLRIAAVILVLFAIGHWFFSPWLMGVQGDAREALMAAAKTDYPVFGLRRSYWDFHVGFGHMAGVTFLMEAALLWLLARGVARLGSASSIRSLLGVLALANGVSAALQITYFFWPPIILSLLVTAILTAAWLRAA
jgi:hypothetical protein